MKRVTCKAILLPENTSTVIRVGILNTIEDCEQNGYTLKTCVGTGSGVFLLYVKTDGEDEPEHKDYTQQLRKHWQELTPQEQVEFLYGKRPEADFVSGMQATPEQLEAIQRIVSYPQAFADETPPDTRLDDEGDSKEYYGDRD